MVVCLEQGTNDLHMVQLMPLPPHHLLLQCNSEWFTFLMLAYPGRPGKRPLNGCSVVVVVCKIETFLFRTMRTPFVSACVVTVAHC